MLRSRLVSVLGFVCFGLGTMDVAAGQSSRLVADVHPEFIPHSGTPHGGGRNFRQADAGMVTVGGVLLFVAETPSTGFELWRSDGTPSGTFLLADIWAGAERSGVSDLTPLGNLAVFRADDGIHGRELWVTDGTRSGTQLLRDLTPGSSDSIPSDFAVMGGFAYFSTVQGLWRTDGTAVGTTLIKPLRPRFLTTNGAGTEIYFRGQDWELWKTDGTAAGTVRIKDLYPGGSSAPEHFTPFGSRMVFRANSAAGLELWITDGTAAGTTMLKDIRVGPASSAPTLEYEPTIALGILYFVADDGVGGREVWQTDGTTAGTKNTVDIGGPASTDPQQLVAIGDRVLFGGKGPTGMALWEHRRGVTRLLHSFGPSATQAPRGFRDAGAGSVLFRADDGVHGMELWRYDGMTARMVTDLKPGAEGGVRGPLTPVAGGQFLFQADDGSATIGAEFWTTDGTAAGTGLFVDLAPGGSGTSSSPGELAAFGDRLLFVADDGVHGREPWVTDGTTTTLLRDLQPGAGESNPQGFTAFWTAQGLRAVFSASDAVHGWEPWVTDGTAAGTSVLEVQPGSGGSFAINMSSFRGRCYFSAATAATGRELWVTDGTAAGTKLFFESLPGAPSSNPTRPFACGAQLFFAAHAPSISGMTLYVTDGTTGGTRRLRDLGRNSSIGPPRNFVRVGDLVVFSSYSSRSAATDLWVSDGTVAGTMQIGPLASGPENLVAHEGKVYLRMRDAVAGDELWVTDGTTAGTKLLKDIRPGPEDSEIEGLISAGGAIYFSAWDGSQGLELWTSDGTSAGTHMVRDIAPGSASSLPGSFVAAGRGIFFAAEPVDQDSHLFSTDGTAAGTVDLGDLAPGRVRVGTEFAVVDKTVYFVRSTQNHGAEIHALLGDPGLVVVLGEGCGADRPGLTATTASVGGTLRVRGDAAPTNTVRFLLFGAPVTPFLDPGLALPDCLIWEDLVAPILWPISSASRHWSGALPVPVGASWIGVRVRAQAVYGPLPFALSNSLQWTVGR